MNDTPKKKRGRPKGSKNITPLGIVVRIPAVCPSCGSTDIKQRRGARPLVRSVPGTLPGGVAFAGMRWTPSECRSCGQCVTVREPVGDPLPEELN